MPIINSLTAMQAEITAWRQDFHRNPELGFDTHRTAGIVADKLREFGCDLVRTGIGRTGVVGVIKGRLNKSGKVIGLRADMDALPIQEETGLEYASQNTGKMHACGHDGHTAMLLGAAKYLTGTRNFDGTAVVVFQPAEEGGGGGREMVNDGLMEEFAIQEIYGMHTMPGLPVGQFAIRSGPFFAAGDRFTIDIIGVGGHAAKPHDAVDAGLAAAHVLVAIQSIAARNIDPLHSAVVSIASIHSDNETFNVLPRIVRLKGTVRALGVDVRQQAETRLMLIAKNTAAAFGATAHMNYEVGFPAMVNAPTQTDFAVQVAQKTVGTSAVDPNSPAYMTAEDFVFMLDARPGAYILLGNGDTPMLHNSGYNFDDAAIPTGCSYWANLIELGMPL